MKFLFATVTLLSSIQSDSKEAQVISSAWSSGRISYFTAGFAILFTAVFLFSYCFKTIINQKQQHQSSKQILRSSIFLALAVALGLIIVLYLFLNSFK